MEVIKACMPAQRKVIKACMPAQRKVIKAFILLWIKAEIIFMVEKS